MMKKLYYCMSLTAFMLLMSASVLSAQERIVSGTVTDEAGIGMPGVNVLVKGSATGTASDVDGNFKISIPGDDAVLVFTFVGYATSEVIVGGKSVVNIQLTPDVQTLSELVVTGYTIQEKKDITGSVGIVKASELVAVPAATAEAQLQGRVAGVNVTNTGVPGAGSTVRIRGFSQLSSGSGNVTSSPLYIVDGVPTYDITTFNSFDIESMNVLKDAGAASIYGARASNGVIVITTKKGSPDGRVRVSYDMFYGSQDPGKGFDNLLNTQEMADLEWLARKNDGLPLSSGMYGTGSTPKIPDYILPSGLSENDPGFDPDLVDPDRYNIDYNAGPIYQITKANKKGTNWFNEVTQKAPIQTHNISVLGGNASSKYYLGLNYFDQKGIIIETFSKRFTVRANSEFTIKKKVRIGENFSVSYRTNPQGTGAGNGNNFNNQAEGNAISQSYRIQPIVPVYDIMGNFAGTNGVDLGNGNNPVANQKRTENNRVTNVRMFGNVYAEADILPELTARTSFGGSLFNTYAYFYTPRSWENSENPPSNSYGEFAAIGSEWVWTNTLSYRKTFTDHKISVLMGTEAVKSDIGRNMSATRINYFVDDPNYLSLNTGSAGQANNGAPNTPATLFSIFGKADYGFKEKYYLSATIRRDGSSRFGPEKRYGVFPSITGMWRISGESFFSSVSLVSDLKLRVGWGQMGNQNNINVFNPISQYGGAINSSAYDINGTNSGSVLGFRQTSLGNASTQWETNETTNIGFDASLLESKITISLDWYQKITKDLLYAAELPGFYGVVTTPSLNVGEMSNKGIELQINYRNEIGPGIRLDLTGTLTTNKNKIEKLAAGSSFFSPVNNPEENRLGDRFIRNQVGESISSFYGYKVIGINQVSDTVGTFGPNDAELRQEGGLPGSFKYADTNNDGIITADDKVVLGSAVPDFTYGLNINVGYKNFDLTVFLYGVQGNEIMNFTKWWTDFPGSFRGAKSSAALNNSWSLDRTNGTVPMASYDAAYSTVSTNKASNSYYMENGSYLRARNIQLAYTLPQTVLSKLGLEKARIYVQGVNLFTITNYSGLNPELGQANDAGMGIDLGNYPTPKQYILGLNITL